MLEAGKVRDVIDVHFNIEDVFERPHEVHMTDTVPFWNVLVFEVGQLVFTKTERLRKGLLIFFHVGHVLPFEFQFSTESALRSFCSKSSVIPNNYEIADWSARSPFKPSRAARPETLDCPALR